MIIYKITNLITNRSYIGQTIRPIEVRWKAHIQESVRGDRYICKTISKYGPDNFKIETIAVATSQKQLDILEQYWIDKLNTLHPSGYNLRAGGNNSTFSESTRKKMSDRKKGKSFFEGKKHSLESRQKMIDSKKGIQVPWNKGIPCDEEVAKKISKSNLGKKAWNQGNIEHFPVIVVNLTTNEEIRFDNKVLAAKFLGVTKCRINHSLSGYYPIIKKIYKVIKGELC